MVAYSTSVKLQRLASYLVEQHGRQVLTLNPQKFTTPPDDMFPTGTMHFLYCNVTITHTCSIDWASLLYSTILLWFFFSWYMYSNFIVVPFYKTHLYIYIDLSISWPFCVSIFLCIYASFYIENGSIITTNLICDLPPLTTVFFSFIQVMDLTQITHLENIHGVLVNMFDPPSQRLVVSKVN